MLAPTCLGWSVITSIGWAMTERSLRTSQQRERVSMERLVQARKDGFELPTVPEVAVQSAALTPDDEVLPPELQAMVDDWESEAGKKAQVTQIKRLQAQGKGTAEIVRYLSPAEGAE